VSMKLLISGAAVCEPSLGEGRSPYTESVRSRHNGGLLKIEAENPRRAGIISPCIWVPTTSTLHLEVVDAACASTSQKMSRTRLW
jgi:hypothetical protein